MQAKCPECHYYSAGWELDCDAGEPIRIAISCGRCHHSATLEGDDAIQWLESIGLAPPTDEPT